MDLDKFHIPERNDDGIGGKEMNVGAILDFVAGELDAQVLGFMQEYAIPPSLMDKVLDRIQSHMRQMKSEEYAQELTSLQLQIATSSATETASVPESTEKKQGTEIDTIEEFKEKMGMKKGEGTDADIQREARK